MGRLIDADALEREGWRMSRIVPIDEKTMELQTRKPTDFPAVEPQPERINGEWKTQKILGKMVTYCYECGFDKLSNETRKYNYCPDCGAKMNIIKGEYK